MQPSRTRHAQFTAAYQALAAKLVRDLEANLPWASAALIEEALADVWILALEREDVDLTCLPRLRSWLFTGARWRTLNVHERRDRDAPVGDVVVDNGRPSSHECAVAREEFEATIAGLSDRQRHVLGLLATGHSYREIGEITGDSPRSVERLSVEGRARARAARPR